MWKLELLLILLSAKGTKLQTSNEVCDVKYCYRWNGKYEHYGSLNKCKSPYFELEIYDADVRWQVKQFITKQKMSGNYYVPLGIKCDEHKCWWKHLKTEVSTFQNIRFADNNRNGIVYSTVSNFDNWFMDNRDKHMCAVICMNVTNSDNSDKGNQIEGDKGQTTKDTQAYKDTQTMIIGIALGTASFALIILMVVLLVLVLKRKRHHDADEKNLKSNSRKSSNLKPITSHDIIIIPSSSSPPYAEISTNPSSSSPYEELATKPLSSTPYAEISINPSSSSSPTYADVLTSDTYANSPNSPNFQTGSRPSAILYGDLDWSKSKKEKKENISKVDNNKEVYENNVLMMMSKVGPMGDEYAVVNKLM